MAKRIVLMRNMGNSGGAWLMKICTMHEKILMLTEINQVLRLKFVPKEDIYSSEIGIDFDMKIAQRGPGRVGTIFNVRTQCELATIFLLQQLPIRKEEVIGLIKCFDNDAIIKYRKFCNSVKVYQTTRNPIDIIDFYTSDKMLRQVAFDASEETSFREHVVFFYKRFMSLIEERNNNGHEIIKLEDINKSLKNSTPFFKEKMENIFEVEWSNDFITVIIEKESYGDDGSGSKKIWEEWPSWKKECFLNSFKLVMEDLNYMSIID